MGVKAPQQMPLMTHNLHPAFRDAQAALFDFDYTLADSSEGIFVSFNYALSEMGLDEVSREEIAPIIGLYLPDALVALKGEENRPRGAEFLSHFTDKADEVMEDATFFLPGAARVLKTLFEHGLTIGIVSTKYRYRIRSILRRDGLNAAVQVVIGGEDVERHKPAPEGLLKASARLGVPLRDCIYVGDSEVDVLAARDAPMPFAAVLTGSAPRALFETYPNRAILNGVADIVAARFC